MANRLSYTTVEAVKAAAGFTGDTLDSRILRHIEAIGQELESTWGKWFLPVTEARSYPWPDRNINNAYTLYLDWPLISLTSMTDENGNSSVNTDNLFLEPANFGPPYNRIEVDRSTSEDFRFLTTSQRALEVTGQWGYHNRTESAGNLDGALSDTTGTTLALTRGDVVGIGDVLLIDSEAVWITDRTSTDLGRNLSSGVTTKDVTDTTLTLDGAPTDAVRVGEILRIGSEHMRVKTITSTTVFEVEREWDGTTLATHSASDDVYIFRSYTMERGVNGTTAATHTDDTSVSRYVAPPLVVDRVIGEVITILSQEHAHFGRTVGAGEGQTEMRGRGIADVRKRSDAVYKRRMIASV